MRYIKNDLFTGASWIHVFWTYCCGHLEKDNAVADFRALIGATDPTEAAEGTIRKEFAESKAKNAVHGSDSDENADIEGAFFFSQFERF